MKNLNKYSSPYEFENKLFRYNYEDCLVEWIHKATEKEIEENEEWKKAHNNHHLYNIGEDGFEIIDTVGLRKENWNNKEIRNEYLEEWCFEINEETSILMEDFL